MVSEKDEVPVEKRLEVTIEKQPENTKEEQPVKTVVKNLKVTIEDKPKNIVKNQQEVSNEKQSETTIAEQAEKTVVKELEMTVENKPETIIAKQSETNIKENPDKQNQKKEKVNDLGGQTSDEDVNDLKLEESVGEDEEINVPTEITSIYSSFTGDVSEIGSKFNRTEMRVQKREFPIELLEKNDTGEDSLFSDISSDSLSVHEERRLSNLLVLREPFLSDPDKMSEQILDSLQSASSQWADNVYSLSHRMDFIQNFEDLPSLSSFTVETIEDEDIFVMSIKEEEEEEDILLDQGVFVNPLTGEIDSSAIKTSYSSIHENGEVEREDQSDDDIGIDIISLTEAPIEVIEDEDISKTFKTFAALKKVFSQEEIPVETEEMILARQQCALTYEFLYQLIDAVVEQSEIMDQNALLARNLSKTKLFQRLVTQLKAVIQEKLLNNELVRKTIDYYKRLKNFRNIRTLSLDIYETESLNYSNNLMRLDFMLKKENESLMHSFEATNIESQHNNELEIELEESENNLKNLILKTFGNPRLATMKSRLENDLKVMAKKRAEIGKARLALIQRQHIVATLQKKMADLEKISNTLTLSTFISKQTEVLKIDKKIEERYLEFKKLQFTFTSEKDKLAHIKEKTQFIEEKIKRQQRIFDKLLTENLEKREFLYKLKLEHSKIIHDIREKSFQSGLLERPALMLDYDNTVDELSIQNEKVLQIQEKLNILQSKIDEVEEKLRNHGSIMK